MLKTFLTTLVVSSIVFLPVSGKAINEPKLSQQVIKDIPALPVSTLSSEAVIESTLSPLQPFGTYSNTYAYGNCTAGVASRLPVPSNWGNANQWSYSAMMAGFTVSSVPKIGAIAQTGGDSYLGHVGIVTGINPDGSIVVWEENYVGLGATDERTTTTAEFPTFIYI